MRHSRTRAKLRLAALVVTLVGLWVVFAGLGVVSQDDIRDFVDSLGLFGPLAFVPISAALTSLLIPGAALAAVSGVLFGPLVGTLAALAASTLGSVWQVVIARATGRSGMQEISGDRLRQMEASLDRMGMLAVAGQRLLPGVPDGPCSYTFGLLGVSLRDIALGNLIGSLPRAFAYAALGSSYDDLSSPIALTGLAVLGLTGLAGLLVARRAYVSTRSTP